jgi:predicted SprT family Zn-dependent metalloprotease
MSQKTRHRVRIGDPVSFVHQDSRLSGVVARLDRHQVFVLGDDQQSYRVSLDRLELPALPPAGIPAEPTPEEVVPAGPALSPSTRHPGERVVFTCRGRRLTGRIARLNARRAHVVCDNDEEYAVPYSLLALEAPAPNRAVEARTPEELAAVARLAEKLLAEHRLCNWSFDFDHAARRAGRCHYGRRRITLSLQFARQASEAEIRETLLHEIAHALVGPRHNHDAVWRAKAKEIGASGERCHDLRFTPPRYIVQCRNGCWTATAERRRRNVVCRKCRGEIVYQTYTEQRWSELQPPVES